MSEKFIEDLLKAVVTGVENSFSSFSLVQGKKSIYVFLCCIVITAISGILQLLGFYTFVNIYEGLIAILFSGVVVLLNNKNTKAIEFIRMKFQKGGKDGR
ncbi:MAG: hypothetical protein IJE43_18985 [Alphaproteobacteria bacterium]|nr:hypothetical protein [Alphaproteobacteria bacterium]